MTHSSEESGIDRKIVDIVQEHWRECGTPLLLSQLGSRISREDTEGIKHEHGNLVTYLRSRLADHLYVLQSGKNPAIIAAMPADAKEDTIADDTMLSGTLRRPETAFPRYHPAFWTAFVKELYPQTRRYVSIGPPPRFQELSDDTMPSDADATEVASEYVVGTDEDIAAVHSSIRRWLGANRLDESHFLVEAESQHKQLPSDDLLGKLILALTPDDLKRMSIPMDIVSKLRRQSV